MRIPDEVLRFVQKIAALRLEARDGWNTNYLRVRRSAFASLYLLKKLALALAARRSYIAPRFPRTAPAFS